MTFDDFLALLDHTQRRGGYVSARCPAHEDNQNSLSVMDGGEHAVFNCHAGCEADEVLEALGITWADWYNDGEWSYAKRPKDKARVTFEDLENCVGVYPYHNEKGDTLFFTMKFVNEDGKKSFKVAHRDPTEGLLVGLGPNDPVLYRWPGVAAALDKRETIYVVEGEKDADALTAKGFTATTNPFGAGSWKEIHTEVLSGSNIVLVRDKDEPGRKHASQVRDALLAGDSVVRVVEAAEGKDVSDHLAAGLTVAELVEVWASSENRRVFSMSDAAKYAVNKSSNRVVIIPPLPFLPQLKSGRMYFLTGHTSDGKTVLAVQWARAAMEYGHRVGFVTIEMSLPDIRTRFLQTFGLPQEWLEEPEKCPVPMRAAYVEAMRRMGEWDGDIIDDHTATAEKTHRYARQGRYDFIIVDHLHRIGYDDERQLSNEIRGMTQISREYDIPVLVVGQLNRPEGWNKPPPVLTSIKGASTIEQEAAAVLAVYRPSRSQPEGAIQILKNRYGHSNEDGYDVVLDEATLSFKVSETTNAPEEASEDMNSYTCYHCGGMGCGWCTT